MGARWAHFVAIGGTGMGALAALLKDQGWEVTGSDGPLYPPMSVFLADQKIPIQATYTADNLSGAHWGFSQERPDLVIVGNAISRGHVEAQAVETLGLKRMSFAAALAEFCIRDRRSFVVAGTHGKTTTTSVLAWIFESLGRAPGFFVGGIPLNFQAGCRNGEGPVFVSEGDEYDTAYWDKESKFLHYRPSWVLCTGIEFDHADIYSSVQQIEESFIKLISLTREGWLLVDDESAPRPDSVQRVAQQAAARGLRCDRYGWGATSRYRLVSVEPHALGPRAARGSLLKIECPEWGVLELVSPMTGRHNALNLCGVVGTLLASGEVRDPKALQQALLSFAGIRRRQEEVYASSRLVVIDDFAHHPTAIRETIGAIRDRYPDHRVAAFFEPRSATSARNILLHEFAASFDGASAVFLMPPTKSNVPAAEKLDVPALLLEMGSRPGNHGKPLRSETDVTALARDLTDTLAPTSQSPVVALVMSNGPFGGLHKILSDADLNRGL